MYVISNCTIENRKINTLNKLLKLRYTPVSKLHSLRHLKRSKKALNSTKNKIKSPCMKHFSFQENNLKSFNLKNR